MMTYDRGAALLAKARNGRKKLANNTYLHRIDDSTLGVKLHSTDVVIIHADGTYTLHDGGWQTVTTKDRINSYSPARVGSVKGVWQIGSYAYHDGIHVDASGRPLGEAEPLTAVSARKRKLDKLCREYVKGFAADAIANGGLTQPGNGDCWGCLFTAHPKDNNGVGNDHPMGHGHIMSHFEDRYYVPSLLAKAVKGCGNPGFVWAMIDGQVKHGDSSMLKRCLSAYLRKLKPELLKLMAPAEAVA